MIPQDSMTFTVYGPDHAALRRAASEELLEFAEPGSRWEFSMHVRPFGQRVGARTATWEAEVDAYEVEAK